MDDVSDAAEWYQTVDQWQELLADDPDYIVWCELVLAKLNELEMNHGDYGE